MKGFEVGRIQLSPQQKRLWSLDRDGSSSRYRAECAVRVRGNLDVEELRRVVADVSRRHEILRTCFRGAPGAETPVPLVDEDACVPLDVVDLTPLSPSDRKRALEARLEELGRESYDLTKTPLLVARLFTLPEREFLLLLRAPALLSDARGLVNLVSEIVEGYRSLPLGERDREPPLQYGDLSAWLNEVLHGEETANGREYWRRRDLASILGLQLPCELARSDTAFEPRSLSLSPPVSWPAVLRVSSERGLAPELFAMACWQCLLSRVIDEERWVVSYVQDGRRPEELKDALGPLARTLPVSGPFSPDVAFIDAWARLQEAVTEVVTWAESFDAEAWLRVDDADDRRASLPFAFEHVDGPGPRFARGATFELEDVRAAIDRFKVKLVSRVRGKDLALDLVFDSSLYRADDVVGLGRQLETLVEDALRRPEARVADLSTLSDGERRRLLSDVNATRRDYPEHDCVHELFEAQVRRVPDAIAVRCGDEALTYAELDKRANRLAFRLRELGVGPGVRVGLWLERSVEVIVGILGVLKAGGAYVPLDPMMPELRLAAMLEDSGAEVVVSDRRHREALPPGTCRVVLLEELEEPAPGEGEKNVPGEVTPENLVYVLFTSGSTGRAKGVALEHRQLMNYAWAMRERFEFPEGASFATVSTVSADLGNTSIYGALTSGGLLHLIPEQVATDPEAYAEYCRRNPIDVLKIVPSHLEALLSCSRPADVLPKRTLVLGGEAVTWALAEKIRSLAPDCAVFNEYGPTETTVGVTAHRITGSSGEYRTATVPIGLPLGNVRVYVLDGESRPVPAGVEGELYVGGRCVARGYLGAPQLTEEKFVADPFSGGPGSRLYRTGDRVRFLPSGEIEFLGRLDHQVKIRGFRVELGEIEATLSRHDDLDQVAVLVREDRPGEPRLVAYVVPGPGRAPDSSQLREFLKKHLPAYMVPSAFVRLSKLPLNANGKLERKALPPPDASPGNEPSDRPRSRWETDVAELWRELLSIDRVDPHDNFYDLGGHSLLAIRVVRELEKRTGLKVSPRELVFHTLRQFAALCESKTGAAG